MNDILPVNNIDLPTQPDQEIMIRARNIVGAYVDTHLEKTDPKMSYSGYIVWFSKTLKKWKALLSTTLPDGKYYELTHNGEVNETYVDVYLKVDNVKVPGERES